MKVYNFFKITKERNEWLGKRYFKIDLKSDSVIQVLVTCGEIKKGRGNTFGIYLISRMTFFSNYLAMNYAVPCSQKEYEKNFKEVLSYLS